MLPFETPLDVTRHIVNAMLSGNHSLPSSPLPDSSIVVSHKHYQSSHTSAAFEKRP